MEQENKQLTLGSLFDGSGGFPMAGKLAGIKPVFASEIEPFPIRVTTKNLPEMKHLGDISKVNGAEIEPVDIITGGFPCQSVSIAGKRHGIKHTEHGDDVTTRSGLFYDATRIIKEMREKTNGQYPRYFVAENVPGIFSSGNGEDFRAVLEEIIRIVEPQAPSLPAPAKGWPTADVLVGDGWSIAYRVIDSQYFGTAQRRKRMYLVADFASERAAEILFERKGVSRDITPCLSTWKGTAGNSPAGTGAAGKQLILGDQGGERMDVTYDTTPTLRAESHHPFCVLDEPPMAAGFCTEHSAKARNIGYEEERSPTLRAGVVPAAIALENHPNDSRIKIEDYGKVQTLSGRMGTGGGNVPLLMEEQVAFGISSYKSNAMLSDNPHAGIYEAETSRTLDTNGGSPVQNQGGIAIVEKPVYALQGSMIGRKDENGPQGDGVNEDVCFTLNCIDRHSVVVPNADAPVYAMTTGSYMQVEKEKSPTLMARDYKDPTAVNEPTYGIGRDTFNQGTNALFKPSFEEELQPTLVAKGPGAVVKPEPEYTVRRLTPVECARLQGFSDDWCDGLGNPNPTDEDVAFWMDVFETHRIVTGGSAKPKTEKQIRKWLADPYSDSNAYRLWGNGIALPCAYFVMRGIVEAEQAEED